MSEVKRFEMEKEYSLDINIVPTEYPDGSFVHYDDYAALQEQLAQRDAQIAALEESLNSCLITVAKYSGPETQITATAANALRAEGVEMYGNLTIEIGKEEDDSDIIYAGKQALLYAKKLREGK